MQEASQTLRLSEHPSRPSPRIVGFDVARCLAILSMVYVNFEVVLAMSSRQPAWLRALASMFEGNASALFVTLAGCGIVMLGRRAVIFKRAALLLVVGYCWQLLWVGDILHYYAFYLTVGALCLGLRARWLWLAAAASIGGFVLAFFWLDYGEGWRWLSLSYPEFWTAAGQLRNLLFNGWHPLFPWLAFLFCGMAIVKGEIHQPRRRRFALVIAALVYGVSWLASHYLSQIEDTRSILSQISKWYMAPESFWGMSSIPPGPLYILSAGATAVFVIALCLELTASPWLARFTRPLALTGQLALTFYLAHVLVLFFVVEPLRGSLEISALSLAAYAALAFGAAAILFATVWRRFASRGPLESVMRWLCG
jgi:uncharacterized protein